VKQTLNTGNRYWSITGTRPLTTNGEKEEKDKETEEESPELCKEDAPIYSGLGARLNLLTQDCLDLQFCSKAVSREMSTPREKSWRPLKRVARYLSNRGSVVWEYRLQEGKKLAHTASDSDWGGNKKDRKSTSGGMWMVGDHCIKKWSASQGAIASSSAEAEFYATIEALTRAKGLIALARELGFEELSNVVHLGTDSSAAKSFVGRTGLGKMRHIEIRELWLQKEVKEGKVLVHKVLGTENPADLMIKILTIGEIEYRLKGM
jgi:hypothetical protein